MTNTLNTLIVDDESELRRSVISILKSAMPEIDFINITLGGEVTDEVTDL